jgi:hypothetical protein
MFIVKPSRGRAKLVPDKGLLVTALLETMPVTPAAKKSTPPRYSDCRGQYGNSNKRIEERLEQESEIQINVTGRKTGRSITNIVWFVLEGDKLYLLPVKGSDSQWFKNCALKAPLAVGS